MGEMEDEVYSVTPSQIEATSFLKYVSVNLIDNIQKKYWNLATYITSHKLFMRIYTNITVQKGVIPGGILPDSQRSTTMALYTQFYQTDTSPPSSYTNVLNLLTTTTGGFEFLQILLQ